jgi:head-tail adaptor
MISYQSVGARDTKYVIQSRSISYDSLTNQQVESWSDYASVWGENLKPMRTGVKDQESKGDEIFEGDQQVAKTIITVRIKYMSAIVPTWRMIFKSTDIYYITGVDIEGRNSYLVITAERRDDNVVNDAVDASGNIIIEDEGIVI